MVKPRSEGQLSLMRQSGAITAAALKEVLDQIKLGVNLLELNRIAEDKIKILAGESSFKTVRDYIWATCLTLNQQVVHGIPRDREIQEGDIVSVDLGAVYKGWHTDAAWTILVGEQDDKERFLTVGEEALWDGIAQAVEGKRVGDISWAIQKKVEGAHFSVVKSLVGHGVGQSLHERPEIPGYGKPHTGMELKKGMTLAIEVIYTMGDDGVVLEKDGWTIKTADDSLSALFEMTVVVGKERPEILTDWRKL